MSKKDLGRRGNRGASNRRIWITVSSPPVSPALGDIWLPEECNFDQFKRRTSTYTHNSNTSMTSDGYITFTFEADGLFNIRLHAAVSGPTGADIEFDWATTGGVAQLTTRACMGPALGMTSGDDTNMRWTRHNLGTDVGYGTETGVTSNIFESFIVSTSGGEGTLTLRHAQRVSDPGNTTISSNTFAISQQVYGSKSAIMRYDAGWNRIL